MTEQECKQDLAIRHYPGKWKAALDMAKRAKASRSLPGEDYWAHVRRTYLELGGQFVGQLDPIQQAHYFELAAVLQ